MKHKVGDVVRIKSLDWYNENKGECSEFLAGTQFFVEDMKEYCGMQAIITYAYGHCYLIDIDKKIYFWTDEMFE